MSHSAHVPWRSFAPSLVPPRLHRVHLGVAAFERDELFVGPLLDNVAVVQEHDPVGEPGRAQPVGDQQDSLAP